ncbi:NAD(P)/FAD-dependent oxidoreductase [Arthrobacter sp. SLBN-53]|uniref:flavin-containing monooxygenase n=1 Tax=Arthrobacter sp. SLBN-53 TaxID=2768412 RepID=UPI00114E1F6A|nr:NAD(P)/FAD-dependent oxidoreductase [Arthrobacter sp. SLBN-53]TQK31838.1 cation diffusion facilitator CzcD-associated flavoprotein CzcO [Arthrobacter sp. SLBN-53]
MSRPDHEVAIIGAGPGGIAAAHHLRRHGITDFVIIERAGDFGGTWRDNHYPGLAVDIPSLWYQLSFAPNTDWSRLFAPGPEIYRYLQDTARGMDLYRHLIADAEVTRQCWDDDAGLWQLSIRGRADLTARFLISSVGGYVNAKPSLDIDGVEDFTGTLLRPDAWDDTYDTAGKRIAVIGTGSSGVQIAAALSAEADRLDVYQRTPAWVLPKIDFDLSPPIRRILRIPGVLPAVNIAGRVLMDVVMLAPMVHVFSRLPDRVLTRLIPLYDSYCRTLYRLLLRCTVRDPATRAALVPHYGIVAKRPVISSAFFRALNNSNTRLITTPIERITGTGIRTVDGVERPVDLLVAATGYELWTDPETYRPSTIMGTDGFDLAEFYRTHGMQSYAGTAHPRLPNRWEIVGPTGFVGFAWCDFVETMAQHAARVIAHTRGRSDQVAAVTAEAFARWNDKMVRRGKTAHLYFTECNPGLRTYFVNSRRETVYHRPQTITAARWFARRGPLQDYRFTRRSSPAAQRRAV